MAEIGNRDWLFTNVLVLKDDSYGEGFRDALENICGNIFVEIPRPNPRECLRTQRLLFVGRFGLVDPAVS